MGTLICGVYCSGFFSLCVACPRHSVLSFAEHYSRETLIHVVFLFSKSLCMINFTSI